MIYIIQISKKLTVIDSVKNMNIYSSLSQSVVVCRDVMDD